MLVVSASRTDLLVRLTRILLVELHLLKDKKKWKKTREHEIVCQKNVAMYILKNFSLCFAQAVKTSPKAIRPALKTF